MVICMIDGFAYVGETFDEAYKAALDTENDHDFRQPAECAWFVGERVFATIGPLPVPEPQQAAKSVAKKLAKKK